MKYDQHILSKTSINNFSPTLQEELSAVALVPFGNQLFSLSLLCVSCVDFELLCIKVVIVGPLVIQFFEL